MHAFSKLVNNVEISDDIISVMRKVVAQYPPKGSPEIETSIEVPLSVRLWRVSGCHELLASLGFDLMEVGQDQVTLRTGKQANRRNCQFVLQALLALFDTQEAPKSLGIDSSSSCESLNEDVRSDKPANSSTSPVAGTSTGQQQRSISPVGTVKSLNLKMPRPPLPTHRAPLLSSGSAFISYVRKRGEPDGGRTEVETTVQPLMTNSIDSSLTNTTDSEFSDGYSSQTLNKFESKPKMGYSSLRAPIKVGRPGGGGESDAAFTPSPPITLQTIDNNVSMALAHQTRIRNLYSATNNLNDCNMNEMQAQGNQRPDSSSSASSTTDWEGSGHATVLRRAQHQTQILPPMPPPRQTLPLVDSLRPLAPLAPVYNNLKSGTDTLTNAIESANSDLEIERSFDTRDRLVQKPMQQPYNMQRKITDEIILMDRLSVRTEVSNNIPAISTVRKPLTIPDDDETTLPFKFNANNLYFSPNDSEVSHLIDQSHKEMTLTKTNAKENKSNSHNKNIQDSILRQINREMTPTISEVYHERNLGLGLAPPLSKLLLSKNYEENETKSNSVSKTNLTETVSDINPAAISNGERCLLCNSSTDVLCNCKTKKSTLKPWLNNIAAAASAISSSDLSSAEILERQTKNNLNGNDIETNAVEQDTTLVSTTSKRSNSPFSDLSRRDEGDGRSVADSQCSGSYKVVDLSTNKVSQIQQRINKFNMNAANNQC